MEISSTDRSTLTGTTVVVSHSGLPTSIPGVIGGGDGELARRMGVRLPQFPALDPATQFSRFIPPNDTDTPTALFGPGIPVNLSIPAPRFIRFSNPREFLIFSDGCCLQNGSEGARGGCAFVYRPET